MPLTGREKATIFLSILGAETSSRILRYLPDELADLIAAGINHLPAPSPEALNEVISEFKSNLSLPQSTATPVARIEEKPKPAKPKKAYNLLVYERPQISALLISLMPEDQREEALFSIQRDRVIIEDLIPTLRTSSLSQKIAEKLKQHYGEKLF